MSILVTGATSHLGANLVRRLLHDGHDVRALVGDGTLDLRALDQLDVTRVPGNVRDLSAVRAAVKGVTQVYHVAAKSSGGDREVYDTNVVGTRNVLSACLRAGVERVVVTGSFSAVGARDDRPSHEGDAFSPIRPHTRSAEAKAWAEHECLKAAADGLDVVIAVPTALVGPFDFEPSGLGRLIQARARGDRFAYLPFAIDVTSTHDAVEGHLLAMERGRRGQRYLFSTCMTSLDEVMAEVGRFTQAKDRVARLASPWLPKAITAGHPLLRALGRDGGMVSMLLSYAGKRADISKATTELGYLPTSLSPAIREQVAFWTEPGYRDRAERKIVPPPQTADMVPVRVEEGPVRAAA